jgi:hypothetical protein
MCKRRRRERPSVKSRSENEHDSAIEREVASSADALRVALMMLARRGRLESGDVLKVMAPN